MRMFDRHLSRQLAAYVDGELTPHRAQPHLAECTGCRAELEQVRLGMAAMERLQLVEAPASLWNSIQAAVDGAERSKAFPIWRFASVVALIIAAIGLYFLRFAWQPQAHWE